MLSEKKKISTINSFVCFSFLTNFFNQKSPTQKFHLHTGLQNILLIFSPGQLWIYWCSCSIRIFRESQKKTRLIYGFLKSEVTNLEQKTKKRIPSRANAAGRRTDVATRCDHQSQNLLFSFSTLFFLIKLLKHQFCLYQCFQSASGFCFKSCDNVTAPVI